MYKQNIIFCIMAAQDMEPGNNDIIDTIYFGKP